MSNSIRLFISHSSSDAKFAERLVQLLNSALLLDSTSVRCTSVEGFRLPGGADTNEQLRQEVHQAETFVGVLSLGSLRSTYVLFELGARWGAGKPLIPLLAPGTPASVLAGPLFNLNALRADNRAQLVQLVQNLADSLSIKPQPLAVYMGALDRVLKTKPTKEPEIAIGFWDQATASLLAAEQAYLNNREDLHVKYLSEAIKYLRKGGYRWEAAENFGKLAEFHRLGERPQEQILSLIGAAEEYGASLASWESAGTYRRVAEIYQNLGDVKNARKYVMLAKDQYLMGDYLDESKSCGLWVAKHAKQERKPKSPRKGRK